jgi:hypothetical protein
MLFRVNDPSSYLIEISDLHLTEETQPTPVRENWAALSQITAWAETFLCRPHARLGRAGDVCPYTKAALRHNLFWLTICRGAQLAPEDVYTQAMTYRDWFLELEPRHGKEAQFKTILMLFPDVPVEDAPKIIDTVQRALKPELVDKGLMVGQFHPQCPEPGLWNQDFRPLQAPVPLLAMRHMVLTDFPFLRKDERFISSYIRVFGDTIPGSIQEAIKEARPQFQSPQPGRECMVALSHSCERSGLMTTE